MKRVRYLFYVYAFAILSSVFLTLNGILTLNNISFFGIRGDYWLHTLLFIPWAFFGVTFKIKPFYWLVAGIFIAIGAESLQHLVPSRTFNIYDLIANISGVLIGFMLFLLFRKFFSK